MPAYRFTWEHFEDRTVAALAGALGFDPAHHGGDARLFLHQRKKRPDDSFVREHKDVLVRDWLSIVDIVKDIPGAKVTQEFGYYLGIAGGALTIVAALLPGKK